MTREPTGHPAEGYPYECIQTYIAPPTQHGTINIHRYTQGEVVIVAGNVAMVTLIHKDPERRGLNRQFRKGWVPFACIQVFTTRKYGDLVFQVPSFAPIVTPTGAPGPHLGHGTQLRRAYECLFEALAANHASLPFARQDIMFRINSVENRTRLTNIIMAGTPPQIKDLLSRPDFTIGQLRNALTTVNRHHNEACVYTIIYWFIDQRQGAHNEYKSPEQYIGKSVDVVGRDDAHRTASQAAGVLNPHYRSAREAGNNRKLGIMCALPGQDNTTHLAVEQANVLLFDTYLPEVRNFSARSNNAEDIVSNAAKYFEDKNQANVLSRIARESFGKSKWPINRRSAGVVPYGAGPGKNWQSPIADWDSYERVQWVRQTVPESGLSFFWRKALKAHRDSNSMKLYLFCEPAIATGKTTEGRFSLSMGPNIPLGTPVYVVIEMMNDGKPHGMHYSRLPDVGKWSDWDEARSFAIKIQWQDEQNAWKQRYLFHNRSMMKRPGYEGISGALNSYAQCLAVARHLKQLRFDPSTLPSFMFNYSLMRIKSQEYIHKDQIMRYSDVVPRSGVSPSPRPKTFQQVRDELRSVGLNAGGPWGQFDWPCNRPRFPSGACDSCHLLNMGERVASAVQSHDRRIHDDKHYVEREKIQRNAQKKRCVRKPHPEDSNLPDICDSCLYLGRVCSWTKAIHYVPLQDPLMTALLPYIPISDGSGPPMLDPGIRRVDPATVDASYFDVPYMSE